MLKKGQYNTAWKMRWCVVQEEKLYYFKEKEYFNQKNYLGFIPLQQAVVRTSTDDVQREFCFELITKDRIYKLVASSHEEMTGWIQALQPQTQLHSENDVIRKAEEQIKQGACKYFKAYEDAVNSQSQIF
uniref:PH domain-containing protein n=1 Tax=Arcella intermedia TaxID=1963864 RepID=A0A6B2LQV5_9EUKA